MLVDFRGSGTRRIQEPKRCETDVRTISSAEFSENPAGALQDASSEPIFILDGDQPSHVLLSAMCFRELTAGRNIGDLLGMPGIEDVSLDLPEKSGASPRPAEFD